MKKLLYILIGVVIVATAANLMIPSVNSLTDLKHINYKDAFDQKEEDYLVYFYQENCGLCQEFGPDLVQAYAAKQANVYVVDMLADENNEAWYDWAGHDEKYTKVIGEVDKGVETFYEGESREKYPPFNGWTIKQQETKLVAILNKAQNNKAPKTGEELDISGTPTLIHIKNGELVGYGEGIDEARSVLEGAKK